MSKGIPRHAAKRDANEAEIIAALELCGASVVRLSQKGVPDLLIGYRGRTFLAEVKSASGKLTDDQIKFREGWDGDSIAVLRNTDDVLAWIAWERE